MSPVAKAMPITIGVTQAVVGCVCLAITMWLIADWPHIDTPFLDMRTDSAYSSSSQRPGSKDNANVASIMQRLQREVRPVWKNEFISLFCILPWYTLGGILLIIGTCCRSVSCVAAWIVVTLVFVIWTFALTAVIVVHDTATRFATGICVAQLIHFVLSIGFIAAVVKATLCRKNDNTYCKWSFKDDKFDSDVESKQGSIGSNGGSGCSNKVTSARRTSKVDAQ